MNLQTRRRILALSFTWVALVACNNPPAGGNATGTSASPAAGTQRTRAKINGKPASEAGKADLVAALQKDGWVETGGSTTTSETTVVQAEKAGKTAKVTKIKEPDGQLLLGAELDGKPNGADELLDSLKDGPPAGAASPAGPARIHGKLVNDADAADIVAALGKVGWTEKGSRQTTTTVIVIHAEKNGKTARVRLLQHPDGEAVLGAEIDGRPEGAQPLIDALMEK